MDTEHLVDKPSLDAQLAEITIQILTDQIAPKDAVGELESIYQAISERLR